jgi:4-hydroxybenzoate polyprenyltransferase
MLRYLIYTLRLRRVEYRIAELPIFLIPVLLTIDSATAFLSLAFWEGLVIFFFLFAFGDLLNCLTDRDLDAIYKPHLTEAVYGIGVRGVVLQAVLSAVAALGLAIHLAWLLDRWLLPVAVVVGLFVAFAYSVPPLRLKGRGLWQLVFYWLGLFTGPMIFAALLFTSWPRPEVVAVCVFFGLMQTGTILVNTAEDYPEDRQMQVRTAIVALGLQRGLTVAWVLAALGSLGLLTTLAILYRRHAEHTWTWAALVPLAVGSVLACWAMFTLQQRIGPLPGAEAVVAVKQAARWVPVWITLLAVSSLLAAVVFFIQAKGRTQGLSAPSGLAGRAAESCQGLGGGLREQAIPLAACQCLEHFSGL